MTPKENTQRLLNADGPERAGLNDAPWGATLRKWVTQGYPTRKVKKTVTEKATQGGKEVEKEVEKEIDEPVPPHEHFGFDMVGVGGWCDMMALRGVREIVKETDEWRIIRNGMGASLKWWKDKDGTPEHVAFDMTSRAVWEEKYKPHLLDVDRTRVKVDESRKIIEEKAGSGKWTHYGTLFIWEHMRQSMGDLCMYESLVLDPDWIHDFNRVYTDHLINHYKILIDEAGVPDGMWLYEDLGFKERLFCSPQTLKELIFPYYAEVVDFFHSYGMKVILHSCGFTMDALPLIVDAGFDGLHPLEVAAGNDIFKAVEDYGDKLVFIGGFDKRIMESGSFDDIRREVSEFMKGMKDRGARFMFGSDHSISTNTDYDKYKCAIDTYREHMTY